MLHEAKLEDVDVNRRIIMKISNLSSKQVIVLVSTVVVTLALGSVAYAIFYPQASFNQREDTIVQDNEPMNDDESNWGGSEQTETPNTSQEPELPNSPKTTFSDGTYRVGFDIASGTYQSTNPSPTCHHEKRSGESVSSSDVNISSNGNSETRTTVTISDGDETFTTSGCGDWTKIS